MSFESLIEKAVAKTGEPIKLKRRNAQPEAIEQAKVIAWLVCVNNRVFINELRESARVLSRGYSFFWPC